MTLISDSFLYCLGLIDTGSMLFLLVYCMLILSDLECDCMHAQECCSKLNKTVAPKLLSHSTLVFLLLLCGHIWLILVNLPLTIRLYCEYFNVPSGNIGVYDPTEIHNRIQLKKHMRGVMIYLVYYFVLFFIYLFCYIASVLEDPVDNDKDNY